MLVQDLFRIMLDEEEVEIKSKNGICLWYGKNEDIPNEYFDKIVDTIYSLEMSHDSYIVITIA